MKEKFKDSALSPKERAEDLLPRLTLREKVGQVNQKLYGFQSYTCNGEHVELADSFKEEVEKWGGLGVLYGLYRADPWANKDYTTGLTGVNAIRAYNLAQHYVLEHSRFGIPMLMSSECPHGHQAVSYTHLDCRYTIDVNSGLGPFVHYDVSDIVNDFFTDVYKRQPKSAVLHNRRCSRCRACRA